MYRSGTIIFLNRSARFVFTYTRGYLVCDEALESLELGLLLGGGDDTGVGRLASQPVVPALTHLLHNISDDTGVGRLASQPVVPALTHLLHNIQYMMIQE